MKSQVLLSLILCCGLLASPLGLEASPQSSAPAKPSAREAAILRRARNLEVGAPVEIRLMSGEKVRGRFEKAALDGFTLKVVSGGQVISRTWPASEVKSVRKLSKAQHVFLVTSRITGFAIGATGFVIAMLMAF